MSAPASSTGPNVRILTKGGVWKNTEDEILKASVMKYGKNQWARISSLLVRKTPKQCKARWYEWLDPSIKKTEWSIQEDEKLLHLAKLMPTQWRTIAPIVGRTPAQCLERYQRLLDEAEAKDGPDDEEALTAEDVRKLRPGEIDPDPETKPARPDPVDMDEDEKEMLSEARARLANTQGKKAKRKARAKQLEDSRRLAVLQKKRELKAAGITMNVSQRRKKQVGMNYNIDIPFHAKAPVGFWNTLDEKEREIGIKTQLEATLLEKLDGKKRSATEFEDRKKDAKRIKQQKNDGAYVSAQALKAALLVENQTSNRKRLVLPAPQISDSDLQEISKMGRVGEKAKQVLDKNGDLSSSTLLNDYSTLNQSTELRTPRIESGEASVKTQARNLYAMMSAQTPLLGGEVDIEGDGGFTGATPKQSISQTPNPMAGQFTPRANGDVVIGQNGRPATVGKTPLRDQMGINTPRTSGTFDDTPRAAGSIVHNTQASLSTLFSTLPKPNNDFEIELDPEDTASIVPTDFTEDAQDVQERNERQKVVRLEKELSERSAAVKMNLPRPHIIRSGAFAIDGKDQVETLLRQEMLLMLGRDAYECPDIGQVPATSAVEYECISADRMESAHALIRAEVERTGTPWTIEEFFKHRETHLDKVIYVASGRSSAGRLRLVSKLGCEEHVAIIKSKIDANRDTMRAEATKCTLLERDLATLLNPYQRQAHDLNRKFNRGWHELVKLERDFAGFVYLKESVEDAGMIDRLQAGQLELDRLMRAEEEVQQRYKELTS